MDMLIDKLSENITSYKYTFPNNAELYIFGMNHAKGLASEYQNIEERIDKITDSGSVVVFKEGVVIDMENIPEDVYERRVFMALKHKLDGMALLAGPKQIQMQNSLFEKLKNKGIEVRNADAKLSELAKDLVAANVTAEYLEDSLTYKLGINGEIGTTDLTQSNIPEQDRELYEKREKEVLINSRNRKATDALSRNIEAGRNTILLYGNRHIEGIVLELQKKISAVNPD